MPIDKFIQIGYTCYISREVNKGITAMATGYIVECKIDTRSVDLDTGKAIAGSGEARACDFCGKAHEIHVYVVSDAGDRKCCGSTCAPKHASDKRGILKMVAQDIIIAPGKDRFGRAGWVAMTEDKRIYDADASKEALIGRAKAIRNIIELTEEVGF